MKKPQWITIGAAIFLTISIFIFARRVPANRAVAETHSADDGHDHGTMDAGTVSIDSLIGTIKKQLSPQQIATLSIMEGPVSGDGPAIGGKELVEQQLTAYHRLEHYWGDSIGFLPASIWYKAEAARLENSEKSLTFAAHLILNNLQEGRDPDPAMIKWKGLQAKDLFERSLKINPDNDSSKVGLGACYLFGNISPAPMEGILKIREVADRDSTNVYAQMTMVKGLLMTGQLDKAISRLSTVCQVDPDNVGALVLLADIYAQQNNKPAAIEYYRKSLIYIKHPNDRQMIEERIRELSK